MSLRLLKSSLPPNPFPHTNSPKNPHKNRPSIVHIHNPRTQVIETNPPNFQFPNHPNQFPPKPISNPTHNQSIDEEFEENEEDDDNLWRKMKQEAQSDVIHEPILSNYYSTTILSHQSIESALARHLSIKLSDSSTDSANSCLPSAHLYDLFLTVLTEDEQIVTDMKHDLLAVKERDPACISYVQCFLNFKGFLAVQSHRIAHELWLQNRKILALIIQNRVSEVFALDIHPGAKIGRESTITQKPQSHHPNLGITSASSISDSILLIVALCFHSVFEGIAIGIADSESNAWKALWTISLHKIFAAIAMGIALLRMIPDRPLLSCASYAFAFGISSPIGVAIGIVIDETTQGKVADWIFAISMGIACGVFVYVSINHLLRGYRSQKPVIVDTNRYKLLAVSLGIGVIAVVMIWDT